MIRALKIELKIMKQEILGMGTQVLALLKPSFLVYLK